jgi:HK97 family phage major capsid protein
MGAELSHEERRDRIARAWDKQHHMAMPAETWVISTFDDHVIVYLDDQFYRVPYTLENETVTFSPRPDWVQVEKKREWVEVVKALQARTPLFTDAQLDEIADLAAAKLGSRNNKDDRERIRSIRAAASNIVNTTIELEPDDEDMMHDPDRAVIVYGDTVKALGNGKIGGRLVRFSSEDDPDLEGEYFAPDTDFGPHETSLVFYHHGLDGTLKRRVLDDHAKLSRDEAGIWIEAQLELRDEYEKAIYQLVEAGKLGWSSGTAPHLVEYEPSGKAVKIKKWPLGLDASLTPTPAEYRNTVLPLKSVEPGNLSELTAEQAQPQGAGDAPAQREPAEVRTVSDNEEHGEEAMSEELDTKVQQIETKLDEAMKAVSDQLTRLTQFMEDSPAVRKSGLFTQDGGNADPHIKSVGDFLLSVKRGDIKRLREVYGSVKASTDGMETDKGESGGYLVPTEFSTEFLTVANASSQILPLVRRVPVNAQAGTYPALDHFTAPTAGVGDTAMAAGLKAGKRAERGTFQETRPKFEQIKWRVNKIGDIVPVSNELVEDSAAAIEGLLVTLIGIAIGAKEEHYIFRGNGVGEPLGILNAPAALGIAPDTDNVFAFADGLEIVSRFKRFTNAARWASHPSVMPDWAQWELGTAGAAAPKITDLGYGEPLLSEHLPQANNAGCVGLYDFGTYLLFEKGGLEIAYSEHAFFDSDEVVWRFKKRLDGQPWLLNAITLADPQGSFTQSPFVYLND